MKRRKGEIGDRRASVPVIYRRLQSPRRSAKRDPKFSLGFKLARSGNHSVAGEPNPNGQRSRRGPSLVPHGCDDPLIRLVQEPQPNRVLERWVHSSRAEEVAPCVRGAAATPLSGRVGLPFA